MFRKLFKIAAVAVGLFVVIDLLIVIAALVL